MPRRHRQIKKINIDNHQQKREEDHRYQGTKRTIGIFVVIHCEPVSGIKSKNIKVTKITKIKNHVLNKGVTINVSGEY